jgi:hypothetical protein
MEKREKITDLYQNMPKIEIGKIIIGSGIEAGKVWIGNEEGEGGDFPVEEVEKLLLGYFNKNF